MTLIQIVLAMAGIAIFAGLYLGDPGKGLRGGLITIALVIAAALVLSFLR